MRLVSVNSSDATPVSSCSVLMRSSRLFCFCSDRYTESYLPTQQHCNTQYKLHCTALHCTMSARAFLHRPDPNECISVATVTSDRRAAYVLSTRRPARRCAPWHTRFARRRTYKTDTTVQATVAVVLLRIVQRDAGLLAEDLDQVFVILREHAAAKLYTTFRVMGARGMSARGMV